MVAEIERLGHAAAEFLDAVAERHADQLAFEIVRPLVVGALERFRVAVRRVAERDAAMRAAILERVDRARLLAHQHDRRVADRRRLEIAVVGDLAGERGVVPRLAAEDAFLFARVDVGVGVPAVRNARPRRAWAAFRALLLLSLRAVRLL